MNLFWVELRRSPARWSAPLIAAVIGGYLLLSYSRWEEVWSQTSNAVQLATGLASPFMTAAAAWTAYRRVTSRLDDQFAVASVNPWKREFIPVAAVLVYAWGPILVAFAVVTAMTAPVTTRGSIWLTYIWLSLAIALLAVGFGYLLGRLLPSPFTVAAAGLTMLILVFLGDTDERLSLMTLYGYPDMTLSWSALAARIGLALAVVGLAMTAGALRDWHRTRKASVRRTVWALGGVSVAVMAVLVYTAGPIQTPRQPNMMDTVCTTDTYPRVCLWQEHEKYLPLMVEYVGRFNELDEFLKLPDDQYQGADEFWEEGTRNPTDRLSFFGGEYGAASGMVFYAMDVSDFPGCEVPPDHPDVERLGKTSWQLIDWFTAYIMDVDSTAEMGVTAAGLDSIDPVLAMPEEQQFEWAREKTAELKAPCGAA